MGNLSYPKEGGGKVSLSFAFSSSKPILKGPLSPLPLLHSGASAATHTRLLNSQTTHNPQKEEEEKRDGGGMETARLKNREKSLALQKGSESYFCFCSRQITFDCSICFFSGEKAVALIGISSISFVVLHSRVHPHYPAAPKTHIITFPRWQRP